MQSLKVVVTAVGLLCGGAAVAEQPKPADGSQPGTDERLVCFAEKTTGSHLRKRICMTPEEREQRRKEDQEAVNKLRRSGATANRDPRL